MKEKRITEQIYSKYSLNDIKKRMQLLGYSDKNSGLKFLNFRLFTSIVISLSFPLTNGIYTYSGLL